MENLYCIGLLNHYKTQKVLILFIFLREAILGEGKGFPVSNIIALEASEPEILITAIPEIPGPLDRA